MEQPDRETQAPEEVQREVDERIDELTREGDELEDRLESGEGDPADVPDPEESSEGGLGVSDLAGDDEDEDDDED